MRRMLTLGLVAALLATIGASADPEYGQIDPTGRATQWLDGPAGGERLLTLQFGPYVIGPGQDLTRAEFEIVGADGFVVAAKPALRLPNGLEPLNTEVHMHHAHWVWIDPNANGYNRWFFGTGEERTRGDVGLRALVEGNDVGYGVQMTRGDRLLLVSMVHNKTAAPITVWIEAQFRFVDGTPEEIQAAPRTPPAGYADGTVWWGGRGFRALTPVLHGSTFDVPRDPDGTYIFPLEAPGGRVGHIWTAPFDGTIVIGAGHVHGGGRTVVVENLGSTEAPCADDGLGFAGGTDIFRAHAFYRTLENGTQPFPSEDLQMGITKPGWRAKIRRGDRIALNGLYDTSEHAYWDAMSFFGFYTDTTPGTGRAADGSCAPFIVEGDTTVYDDPDPAESVENRSWDLYPTLAVCGAAYGARACETTQTFTPGPVVNTIQIGGFAYLPGDHAVVDTMGSPTVRHGDTVRFVNTDMAADIRHTVTSCPAPCNGPYVANYPQADGLFDSRVLGPDPVYMETANTDGYIYWDLDTSTLDPGTYTYFCRIHPWMRGSLMVQA